MGVNVLVFTTRADICVEPVLKTLKARGLKGFKINVEDFLQRNSCTYVDILTSSTKEMLEAFVGVSEVSAIWFRRRGEYESSQCEANDSFIRNVSKFQLSENLKLKEFFYSSLASLKVPKLGSFSANAALNKLIVLRKAKEIGLNVPDTTISNDIEYVKSKMNSKLITKAIDEAPRIFIDDKVLMGYTSMVRNNDVVTDNLALSLFQRYIEAIFDIRTIYIHGQFFTVGCYVSGKKVPDIRFYQNRVRNFPFELPKEVRIKLKKLLTHFNIDFGCVDLCLGSDGVIYFFEINPGGTFSGISKSFNYNVENCISDFLSGKNVC